MHCSRLINFQIYQIICILVVWQSVIADEPPEGYYAFIESPNAIPPRVRPPPYTNTDEECYYAERENIDGNDVSLYNFCGDLNKGIIPRNPMKQSVYGEPYPFDLIRNHTLKFLSKALPALTSDAMSIPKVTELVQPGSHSYDKNNLDRHKRSPDNSHRTWYPENITMPRQLEEGPVDSANMSLEHRTKKERKFCEEGGIFCSIYKAITGAAGLDDQRVERRDEDPAKFDSPPTPCPAKVEYVTPIFARSYIGSWRYVVQIPYEGYFTQTVEVTKCLQVRCYYLDGGCLSSPRWVSLLVAEIFYPNNEAANLNVGKAPPVQDFQAYQQFLQKRAGLSQEPVEDYTNKVQCDGHDEIGCFQVRLYYDWFLIPGSCKCWKPQYFQKYVKKQNAL